MSTSVGAGHFMAGVLTAGSDCLDADACASRGSGTAARSEMVR
jgi:hypothetical protein